MKKILGTFLIILLIILLAYNVILTKKVKECENFIDTAYSLIGQIVIADDLTLSSTDVSYGSGYSSNYIKSEEMKREQIRKKLITLNTYLTIEKAETNDNVQETGNNQETEFALISGNSKLVLGKEITDFSKVPISTTENRGDGYVWDDIVYDDIKIRVVKNTDDGSYPILEMVTTSNNYETPRGIKVGDDAETLKEAYLGYIEKDYHGDWGDYYIFHSEDKFGFCKIMFYTENDVITKISVFDRIDG